MRLSVEVPPVVCEDCYRRVIKEFMKQAKVKCIFCFTRSSSIDFKLLVMCVANLVMLLLSYNLAQSTLWNTGICYFILNALTFVPWRGESSETIEFCNLLHVTIIKYRS